MRMRWRRSRAPHGARGLKPEIRHKAKGLVGRAPHGARGLKHSQHTKENADNRRAPHGARGLKQNESGGSRRACGARGLKLKN